MATHANAPGKWIFWIIIALLVAAVFFFILRPEPEWVDLATAERGPMEVTIREEGKTRVKDRYQISAPVTGYLHRVQMDVGDPVSPGQLLTRIDPMPASILDARTRAEAEARAAAAASALQSIRQKVAAAQAEYDFARQEYQRLQSLAASRFISGEQLQQAETTATRAAAILRSTKFDEEVADRSPVTGALLNINRKSEGVIQAGEAILEVGDPSALEVVIDVLSFDATKLTFGLNTRLTGWGGPALDAVVRRVEPIGFEDVSALGVEEQRVKVIADMVSPYDQWKLLGDGYRVDAEFILWQSDNSLQIPASALFRHDGGDR